MSNTSKILAGILVVSLLFGLGGSQAYEWFFGEYDNQRTALKNITKLARNKEVELRQAQAKCRDFLARLDESLPPDPSEAQVSYQEYLVRLTELCGLQSVVVSSGQPELLEGLGHTLHFSIQGTGKTKAIGKCIDAVYKTEALHRLSHVNVFQSLGPDAPTHSFALDIEVLILEDAVTKEESESIALPKAKELKNLFATRDIFRRPVEKKPKLVAKPKPKTKKVENPLGSLLATLQNAAMPEPKPIERKPPPPNPRDLVRFVGVIEKQGVKSALFFNSKSGKQESFSRNESLQPLGIESLIKEIRRGSIVVEESNQLAELPLGATYRDATQIH